jgi:hypothetical protein
MQRVRTFTTAFLVVAIAIAGGVFGSSESTDASSHREAPYISTDPEADATDVYAFVSPDDPDMVTLIANYIPFQLPASGPNFYNFGAGVFGGDVLYEINVDNDGDARDDMTFQFRFRTEINNGDTFLYNTGPITSLDDEDLNIEQFYSVSMLEGNAHNKGNREGKVIASDLQVAPYNVGPASYPGGYQKVADEAIHDIGHGMKVFAGPRDDPFFIDLGGTFDLLQLRAIQGLDPVDDLAGLNVHSIAIQVPKSMLRGGDDPVIGVRTTSYRRSTNVLRNVGKPGDALPQVKESEGPWVQISRLDNPLVNEVVIPLKDKDRWNASKPSDDTQFLEYVTDPELGRLFESVLKLDVPEPPRKDLVTIFLTGIPDLNQPKNVTPSSQLRLNMDVAPAGEENRLGVLGGDTAGYPNGRRLADDVVDISLRAVAGGTPFTPEFNKAPNSDLADGVNTNDVEFMDNFPYLACPHDYTGNACGETQMPNAGAGGTAAPGYYEYYYSYGRQ